MNNINKINNKGISYCINRNVELISIVMILSNYYNKYPYLKTTFSLGYLDEVYSHFDNFSKHPVIVEFEKLAEKGFCFDRPLATMIFCDEELKLKDENLSYLNNKLSELTILEISNFLTLLRDFSQISSYNAFFQEHHDFYNYVLRKNIDFIPNINFQDIFTEYYGISPKNIEVILSVTFGGVGFCISGNSKTSIVLGTSSIKDNVPIIIDKNYFIEMLIHEVSHSYVNTLIDNITISIKCCSKLYNSLHKVYQDQYGNDKSLVSEEVVRAVTARIISLYIDEKQSKNILEFEKSQNFIAVEPLYFSLLNQYENNRKKYDTFNKFTPELITNLEKI